MVFGHNLHYMAPFATPRAGFCMAVQRTSFVFVMPWGGFGSLGSDLGAYRPISWPEDLLGPKNGPEKDGVVMKCFSYEASRDST